MARRFARALFKIAKFGGTNAFAEHTKHDRSRLFEIALVLVRFNHVVRFIVTRITAASGQIVHVIRC